MPVDTERSEVWPLDAMLLSPFGATSEYPATHTLLKCTAVPWSAVRSQLGSHCVFTNCYRGPRSHSQWVSNEVRCKVKCYRGPRSRSRWVSNGVSCKVKCYCGPQSHSRWKSNEVSCKVNCYRGLQSLSWWGSNEVSCKLKCYRCPVSCSTWSKL